MPKKKYRTIREPEEVSTPEISTPKVSEKERLLALHKVLTDLGVNRISQLENLIARAE